MPSTENFSEQHRHQVRQVWVGLIILTAIIASAAIITYYQRQHRPIKVTTAAVSATPLSFSDFVGTITKIEGKTLSVDVVITDQSAQAHHRTYRVLSDDQTVVKIQSGSGFADSTFAALKIGDRVQVAAADDVAQVNQFTATKIYQLVIT